MQDIGQNHANGPCSFCLHVFICYFLSVILALYETRKAKITSGMGYAMDILIARI